MSSNIYVGLVHYPVYNMRKEVIATAVTNFDIHDISRCVRSYGLGGFFVITPLESQVKLVERIINHWRNGKGSLYNSLRKEALSLIRVSRSLDESEKEIFNLWKKKVIRVSTSASLYSGCISFKDMKQLMKKVENPFLIIFGTGWGLTKEIIEGSDYILQPIEGKGYNHFSVRCAVAIILDRLFGERIEENENRYKNL